jgi:hypothetical protein
MIFKLTFQPDEKYYKEAYEELISLSRLKKWEPILATAMTLFGIGLYCFDTAHVLGMFPFFFVVIGIYEVFKCFYSKRKWLKERNESKVKGQLIEMEFDNEAIKHSGPFSTGAIKWAGLKEIKKTTKGIVLKPETGVSIYLSDTLFSEQKEIDFILSKRRQTTRA